MGVNSTDCFCFTVEGKQLGLVKGFFSLSRKEEEDGTFG